MEEGIISVGRDYIHILHGVLTMWIMDKLGFNLTLVLISLLFAVSISYFLQKRG